MRAATALVLILAACPAFAAEIEAASRITNVTVYPDGASVTRALNVDLPEGTSTVILHGLPTSMNADSIRVEGQGSAAFQIVAVDVRQTPSTSEANVDFPIEAKIKALNGQREALGVQIEAAEARKAMIERYSQASPEKLGAEAKPLDVGQWGAAWDAVSSALGKTGEELRVLNMKARGLEDEIAVLENHHRYPREITISLDSSTALKAATLKITYRVVGAHWRTFYDARLTTDNKQNKPSIEVVRRAEIKQSTGEDWTDVGLTLSTVRLGRGSAAPRPTSVEVSFQDMKNTDRQDVPRTAMKSELPERVRLPNEASLPLRAPAPIVAEEREAVLETGAYQASYTIPSKVSVPQDGAPKSVRIASATFSPTLAAKAAPVLDPTAYLEASFVNEGDAPLLPGQVSLTRDGTFVGRGSMKLVAPGEKVSLGFGADDQVKVTRVPLKREAAGPGFLGSSRTDEQAFKINVKNLHPFPLTVTVEDRVPYSENADIKVDLLPSTTPPTAKDVEDRRGVLAWTSEFAPGQEKAINLAYRLTWPADKKIVVGGGVPPMPLPR